MTYKLIFTVTFFSATIMLWPMPLCGARDSARQHEVKFAFSDSSESGEKVAMAAPGPKRAGLVSDKLDRHGKEGKHTGRAYHHNDKRGRDVAWEMAGSQYAADIKGDCHRSDTCADYFDFDERSAIGEPSRHNGRDFSGRTFASGGGANTNTQASTPEPSSVLLILVGLAGFAAPKLKSILTRLQCAC